MTAAAGPISLPVKYFRDQLANCATWQSFVGAADAAEALPRIHHVGLPPPDDYDTYTLTELETMRPLAIVAMAAEGGFERTFEAKGTSDEFTDSGRLELRVDWDIPDAIKDQDGEIEVQFLNTLGAILNELCALAGTADYVSFTTIRLMDLEREDEDAAATLGDVMRAWFEVEWYWGVPA